jgi:hypothetical protein
MKERLELLSTSRYGMSGEKEGGGKRYVVETGKIEF